MAEDTIVLYPSPGRGHIISMIELAKLITRHHPSLSISIIILTPPNQTLSINSYTATAPSINFIHLPAVSLRDAVVSSSFRDTVASFYEFPEINNPILHQALTALSNSTNLKALVIDFFCNSAAHVSSALNIPTYYFYTTNATALCYLLYWPTIHKNITESLKDVDVLVDVPGAASLPSKDVPMVMLDRSHRVYQYFIDTANKMAKSDGLIINSFESLEPRAVKALVEGKCIPDVPVPPIFCIGPLVSSNEEKEEHECLNWLNSQPSRSVVFLCFGSMGFFPATQLKEIAIGLEKSGVRFLWVVRNPLADDENENRGSLEYFLPEGFLKRTNDRGFVVNSWAPQVAVLNHDSVSVFVTHCGWNSILESIWAGVPMLAWPLYAEQKINRKFLVEDMKVALSVTESEDGSVNAMELEQRLSEIMNSEKGKEIQKQVMAIREAAVDAVSDGGSSHVALARLVNSFKQAPFSK